MGEVYAARPSDGGPCVALKTLARASASHLYRFKREFRALCDVHHPNLIELLELYIVDGERPFFTMELIAGEPFVHWVRRGTPTGEHPPLERLLEAFRQLAAGLGVLHARNCIHRDLKPSNILVTRQGRVVLLDFGLVSELEDPDQGMTHSGNILGTPAYMAPEQARGGRADAAADLYAVGVILFECLTGHRPHVGNFLELLARKHEPLLPCPELDRVPEPLRDLCVELLAREPDERPDVEELSVRLDGLASEERRRVHVPGSPAELVGRARELAQLRALFNTTQGRARPVVVHVRGPSGQGKSELLRHFRGWLRGRGSLVLQGRCREHEAIPYKGVDEVIDGLSVYLHKLLPQEREALRPRGASTLAQAFPVLEDMWPSAQHPELSARELRAESRAELSALLAKLTHETDLVIQIDDFQWTDIDSIELLEAVLRSPPAGLTLILALRSDAGQPTIRERLEGSELLGRTDLDIELRPLSTSSAQRLTRLLAQQQHGRELDALTTERIALRSAGNPFFIIQLVQALSNVSAADSDLDAFIRTRLDLLPEGQRALLELIALAGGPLAGALALELCPEASTGAASQLQDSALIVRNEGRQGVWLETAHDRVREVTIAALSPERRAVLHHALGEGLLARHERTRDDGLLFRALDQFHASAAAPSCLEERLRLARYSCLAGERAMAQSSHALAETYFARAQALAAPFMDDARCGGEHYALCLAITFGWARVTDDPCVEDRLYDDLLAWTLTPADYENVAVERLFRLFFNSRNEQVVALGGAELQRLGLRLPEHVSSLAALWRFVRGARALSRLRDRPLVELQIVAEPRQRTLMSMLPPIYLSLANLRQGKRARWLIGRHARMIARRGRHEGFSFGIGLTSIGLAIVGRASASQELWAQMCEFAEGEDTLSMRDRAAINIFSLFFEPRDRSFKDCLRQVQPRFDRCCDLGLHGTAAQFVSIGSMLHFEAGTPLDEVPPRIRELETRARLEPHPDNERAVRGTHWLIDRLRTGSSDAPAPELDAFASAFFHDTIATRLVWLHVLYRDYAAAWPVAQAMSRDYERSLYGYWATTVFATAASVLLAERARSSSRQTRRRDLRALHRHRAVLERWTRFYRAESYAPMLTLVDAELASLGGRPGDALDLYMRASEGASEQQLQWLAGLASQRLATQAQRAGHKLFVDTALEQCLAHYRAWGAQDLAAAQLRAPLSC
ncbi:Predicted ATPase [Plesiocystis pacifica SIR-1]|uniref:Predicted ATPase n=2 Tax=Plesiocystis pacifica TaxID=191768 RepID=A6G9N5_9BACT|nr:Predicted ATPase [Plesiocystis pacifica SIR-1]